MQVYGQLVDDKETPIFGIQVKAIIKDYSFFVDNHSLGEVLTDKNGEFKINLTLNPELVENDKNQIRIEFLIDEKPIMSISKDIKEEIVDLGIIKFDKGILELKGKL
jgi:hypothetical protein